MLELTKENFEKEVLHAKGLVLVDFYGEACQPCQALMPQFEALSQGYEGKVTFAKLNTTHERRLTIGQRVLGLPTVVLYKDGNRVGECIKEDATLDGMKRLLENYL